MGFSEHFGLYHLNLKYFCCPMHGCHTQLSIQENDYLFCQHCSVLHHVYLCTTRLRACDTKYCIAQHRIHTCSSSYDLVNINLPPKIKLPISHQRQIILRIVGYHFSSRLTGTPNLCPIYLKLLVHVLRQYVLYLLGRDEWSGFFPHEWQSHEWGKKISP